MQDNGNTIFIGSGDGSVNTTLTYNIVFSIGKIEYNIVWTDPELYQQREINIPCIYSPISTWNTEIVSGIITGYRLPERIARIENLNVFVSLPLAKTGKKVELITGSKYNKESSITKLISTGDKLSREANVAEFINTADRFGKEGSITEASLESTRVNEINAVIENIVITGVDKPHVAVKFNSITAGMVPDNAVIIDKAQLESDKIARNTVYHSSMVSSEKQPIVSTIEYNAVLNSDVAIKDAVLENSSIESIKNPRLITITDESIASIRCGVEGEFVSDSIFAIRERTKEALLLSSEEVIWINLNIVLPPAETKLDFVSIPDDYIYNNIYDPVTGEPYEPLTSVDEKDVKIKKPDFNPIPVFAGFESKDVPYRLYALFDLLNFLKTEQAEYAVKYAGMAVQQAVSYLLTKAHKWVQVTHMGDADYKQIFKLLRWYTEGALFSMVEFWLIREYDNWPDKNTFREAHVELRPVDGKNGYHLLNTVIDMLNTYYETHHAGKNKGTRKRWLKQK